MAARGSEAKLLVQEKIKEAFGQDFIDINSGKIYVWANDGGEKVQIAISLTCPKVEINAAGAGSVAEQSAWDVTPETSATEITQEEQENITNLIKALGL